MEPRVYRLEGGNAAASQSTSYLEAVDVCAVLFGFDDPLRFAAFAGPGVAVAITVFDRWRGYRGDLDPHGCQFGVGFLDGFLPLLLDDAIDVAAGFDELLEGHVAVVGHVVAPHCAVAETSLISAPIRSVYVLHDTARGGPGWYVRYERTKIIYVIALRSAPWSTFFAHLAAIAFFAISERRFLESFFARALPPSEANCFTSIFTSNIQANPQRLSGGQYL